MAKKKYAQHSDPYYPMHGETPKREPQYRPASTPGRLITGEATDFEMMITAMGKNVRQEIENADESCEK